MGLGDTTGVNLVGDTSGLQDELRKAGIVAGDMSAKIRGSAADAGAAMADLAKMTGASVDEQTDAAGRAAAAWTEASARMTRAQRAAGDAAARAAKAVGASVDEQREAYGRAVAAQAQLEESQKTAGDEAERFAERFEASAAAAAKAAQDLAVRAGISADEQADAAGRAAAAWTEQAAKMSGAQKAAGDAAATAARVVGASLDEQAAAYDRSVASVGRYEAAQKAAADATEQAAARQKEARAGLAEMGGRVALGATVGGGISAYESVKGAMALQSQMERLHTQAGVSQGSVAPMQQAVLGMAGQVGEAPDQLAQGLYHVASQMNATLPPAARMSTELNVLRVAAEGAKVGGADLTDVTNALGAAVVSGIKGVQNYRQAMGAMNATVGAGDMQMQDLAEAFGTGVVVQAKEAGVSIQQLGGALATLGDNNIRGAKAGTLLASTLRIMKAPSEAATEALNSVGLSSTSLASALRSGGIEGALELLKQHLAENGAAINGTSAEMNRAGLIMTRAFGGRQSAGLQDLMGQMDRLKSKTEDVGQGMNTFGAAVAKNNQTAQQEFDELKAHVAALGDEFGLYLIPKLEDVARETADVIGWMKRHQDEADALAAVIGGVLGTALTVYAYTKATAFVGATKNMLTGIGDLANGAGSAASAIAAKLGIVGSTAETTSTEFEASTGAMVADADAMETGIVTSADGAAAGVDTALGSTGIGLVIVGLGIGATELATHWSTAMDGLKDAAHIAEEGIDDALNDGVLPVINTVIKAIDDLIRAYDKLPFHHHVGTIGTIGDVNLAGSTGQRGVTASSYAALNGPAAMTGSTSQQMVNFADTVLERLGITPTTANVRDFTAWERQEGGNWANNARYNPLNTTQSEPGAGNTGSQGNIKQYTSWAQGINATVSTLQNGSYGGILAALRAGVSTGQFSSAVAASPWGTGAIDASGVTVAHPAAGESSSLRRYLSSGGSSSYSSAAATSTIPVSVATMLATAQHLEGTRYVWGGGHSGWDPVEELKKIGLDCSGFVSQVLHAGGVNLPGPQNTAGLASNLQRGKGRDVTVYDRPSGPEAHTFMEIMGRWFMEGGNTAVNPSQTVVQLSAHQAAQEMAGGGFQAFHPIIGGKLATDKQLEALGLSESGLQSGASTSGSIQSLVAALLRTVAGMRHAGGRSDSNVTQDAARMSGTIQGAQAAGDTSLIDQYGADPARISSDAAKLYAQLTSDLRDHNVEAARKAAADLVRLSASSGEKLQEVNKAWAAYVTSLSTTGTALLTKLQNDTQNGSVRSLESALGISTATTSPQINQAIASLGTNATDAQISSALSPILTRQAALTPTQYQAVAADTNASQHAGLAAIDHSHASTATKASERLALNARVEQWMTQARSATTGGGTKTAGEEKFDKLITSLRAAHTKALTQLAGQLVTAHRQALATLTTELYAQQITKDGEALTLQATQLKDQTTAISDAAADGLTVQKAIETQQQDAITEQTTAVQSMTQLIQDRWTAAAQALSDAATLSSDAASAAVQGINDQTQTQVDILGERGLYGLNLIAQKLQVQLDEQKTADDQAIALAQQNLDVVTAQWHAAEAVAQQNVDQITLTQQALAAAAQQAADTIAVSQGQKVAAAQAHSDSVQLSQDVAVQLAQTAEDLSANAPKATQDKVAAQLALAQARASQQEAIAGATLAGVQNAANAAIDAASANATAASDQANALIAAAQQQLATVTGQANYAIQQAQNTLTGTQNQASVTEAGLQGGVSVAQAQAQTEFAGSGLTVNVIGLPMDNATAVASEVGWVARTQLGMAA